MNEEMTPLQQEFKMLEECALIYLAKDLNDDDD